MRLRVLTWNLYQGRSVPPAGRDLLREFGAQLFDWEWDVALLQEVPPWWPAELARRPGVSERSVLTSRNSFGAVRRALASRWPDLLKSQGGGANAILVRDRGIAEHRAVRLCRLPERRWMHAVRLEPAGVWLGNLHCSGKDEAAGRDAALAGEALLAWAGGRPAVLGGDFNLRAPAVGGFAYAGGHYVDHVLLAGAVQGGATDLLDAGGVQGGATGQLGSARLSDHRPVVVELALTELRNTAHEVDDRRRSLI